MDREEKTLPHVSAAKNQRISNRRTNLSEAKRALLEKRLRGRGQNQPDRVQKSPADARPYATFAQERLWFLHQLNPKSVAYNMHAYVRIQGPLNALWLQHSINAVVQRHDILRTTFLWAEIWPDSDTSGQAISPGAQKQLLQQVAPQLEIDLRIDDLRGGPLATRNAEQEQCIQREARAPFDLATGPLLRTRLLRLDDQDWFFLLTMHHAIIDEWSVGLFWQEVSNHYKQLADGRSADELPETTDKQIGLQYTDFAYWQRQRFEGGQLDTQKSYWQEQLKGDLPILQLPLDRPRPAIQSFDGGLESIALPSALAHDLRKLSNENGTTLFTTLLAAFNLLLYRYSGQKDILVGTPIANRSTTEFDKLIGLFLNTLVLRTDLSGKLTFLEHLERSKESVLGAFSNQELPFEKLVESLNVARDPSLNPLFQVMFVLQLDQTETIALPELTITPYRFDAGVSKFDLTLFMNASGDELSAAIEYNSALFDRETIQRMLGHLAVLLTAIVEEPTKPIAALPLLTPSEEKQLLVDWNQTTTDDHEYQNDDHLCIHNLIEKIASEKGMSNAIVYEGEAQRYAQLDQRANQLAHHLQSLGVEPEVCVGICMERSVELFVAMLAVLKAGGAYVPIDPAYPPERVAFMLEDCAAPVLLTTGQLARELAPPSTHTICLDRLWSQIAKLSSERPTTSVAPENLAYMIYTSGSTGTPKGVMVTHRNLVHSTNARFHYFPEAVQSFLLLSSFSFDSSVVGIYWTLCSGGTLVLPRANDEKDLMQLARLIEQHRVSHLLALPSLYELLLTYAEPAKIQSLRTAIVAGEACPTNLPQLHFDLLPQTRLYNEYGPTEGTVWSNVYELVRSDSQKRTSIPIGPPIPNMQAYILDENRQPVPIGVAGELYISGLGIARGYYNQPELTDEKFVSLGDLTAGACAHSVNCSSPTVPRPSYRTGDLARWLPDGNIEFLGRIDQQVKIRGHRIELSEIEQVLNGLDSVREAVVMVQEWAITGPDSIQVNASVSNASSAVSIESLSQQLSDLDQRQAAQLLTEAELESV